MPASDEKPSFMTQLRSFPANFWVACFMEILERLAFFAVRAIAPLFLVASSGSNGLGLDYAQKGIIYMVWTLLQIPCVTIPHSTGAGGLPVGIQLVARRGDDRRLLALAKWVQARL